MNTGLLTRVFPSFLPPTFSFEHKIDTGRSVSLCFIVFSQIVFYPQSQSLASPTFGSDVCSQCNWISSTECLNLFIVFHSHSHQLNISNTFYTTAARLPGMLLESDFRCFYTKHSQKISLQTEIRGLGPSSSHSHKQPLPASFINGAIHVRFYGLEDQTLYVMSQAEAQPHTQIRLKTGHTSQFSYLLSISSGEIQKYKYIFESCPLNPQFHHRSEKSNCLGYVCRLPLSPP